MLPADATRLPPFYDLAGRALLAFPFLAAGTARLLDAQTSVEAWSGAGVGAPEVVHYGSLVIELAGGALLVLGIQVWSVAAVLLLYLLPLTFLMHVLPGTEDAAERMHVARNLAIVGGLLLAAGVHRGNRPRWFRPSRLRREPAGVAEVRPTPPAAAPPRG